MLRSFSKQFLCLLDRNSALLKKDADIRLDALSHSHALRSFGKLRPVHFDVDRPIQGNDGVLLGCLSGEALLGQTSFL